MMDSGGLRRELIAIGKRPIRALGQHFLANAAMADLCVGWAGLAPGDGVVEIGPGLGTLTEPMLQAGAIVHAVELDGQLVARLTATLGKKFSGQLFLIHGDAVLLPLAGLGTADVENCRVVANLPFSITGPWFDALLAGPLPRSVTIFLQREMAERLLAAAPSRLRSALGVRLALAYRAVHSLAVPADAFHPRPAVDAMLIHWDRLPEPFCFSQKGHALLRHCFHNRRKLLKNAVDSLASHPNISVLRRWLAHITARGRSENTLRAEELGDHDWQFLELLLRTAEM
ncbi:MAG: hypothetical protein LBP65_03615 [Puniceicoccales bacterium]|jgi:16S rRNA (adenine1518-N6/adenine1519-N6)-dimethyltransferase|nr:hypothetical protein [Puniceicoccales bacterium]